MFIINISIRCIRKWKVRHVFENKIAKIERKKWFIFYFLTLKFGRSYKIGGEC